MLRDSNNVRVVIYANNNGYIVTKTGEVITPKCNKRTLVPHG